MFWTNFPLFLGNKRDSNFGSTRKQKPNTRAIKNSFVILLQTHV